MFVFLGRLTGRHPRLIVLLGFLLVLLGAFYSKDVMQRLRLGCAGKRFGGIGAHAARTSGS